ncbi:MAG: WYL domain-containing protein [Chloroflexales bacterium]
MSDSIHTPRRGGTKRDSWRTFHRRLFLVRRLVRGAADAATLIADTRAFFNASGDVEDIYPGDARAALRHDMAALRDEFECAIDLGPDRRYALNDLGRLALLDMPDADLEALAFLISTFGESALPNAGRVDALLDRMVALLPADRRAHLRRPTRDVRLDYPQPSRDTADRTLDLIRRAVCHQEICFAYRSSYAQGDAVVQHRVAPYEIFFRDGHTYLEAFCLACGIPDLARSYVIYRLDRIIEDSLELLPDRLPPVWPNHPRYQLRYVLAAPVARQRDIALWFPEGAAVFRDDGSAVVTAQVSDLWQARQILLRYREHCRVLEPPELVAMLRESVQLMGACYASEEV